MTILAPTPGQTIGPFFGYALPFDRGNELVPASDPTAIRLIGRVLDGEGSPVRDALIELWQFGPAGLVQTPGALHRDGRSFTGWGRASTDNTGTYWFTTRRPAAQSSGQLPFFAITVFARGLLDRVFTRAYLPVDTDTAAADPFLSSVPADRRDTLVVFAEGNDLRFDIRLQGEGETVFVRYPGDKA